MNIDNLSERELMVDRFKNLLIYGNYPVFKNDPDRIRMARTSNESQDLYLALNSSESEFFWFNYFGATRLTSSLSPLRRSNQRAPSSPKLEEGFSGSIQLGDWRYVIHGRRPVNPKVLSLLEDRGVELNISQEYIKMYRYLNTRETFLEAHQDHATGLIFIPILPIAWPIHRVQKTVQQAKDKHYLKKVEEYERKLIEGKI